VVPVLICHSRFSGLLLGLAWRNSFSNVKTL
jgi:hypothetical protein